MMQYTIVPATVTALAGTVLSLVLVPILSRLGMRWGLLDYPGGRKQHAHPVPLVGGVAIVVALFVAFGVGAIGWPHDDGFSPWFLLAIVCMLLAGVLDDWFDVSHRVKAFLQFVIILPLILLTHVTVGNVGDLFGAGVVSTSYLAIPFTLVCLFGYINAANMIDGLDGLAAGVALIALVFLGTYAGLQGSSGLFVDVMATTGATLGFMVYNLRTPWRSRAMAFLGDAGSMVLGLVVGWCAIKVVHHHGAFAVSAPCVAWVLALPVMDTLVVMTRRLMMGRSPFSADRLHLHHVLMDMGLTPRASAYVLLAISFLYGLFGLLGYLFGLPDWLMFITFLGMLGLHAIFVFMAHRHAAPEPMRLHADSVIQ